MDSGLIWTDIFSKRGIMGFRKRYMPSALLDKIRLLYNNIKEEFEKKKKKHLKFSVSNIGDYFHIKNLICGALFLQYQGE